MGVTINKFKICAILICRGPYFKNCIYIKKSDILPSLIVFITYFCDKMCMTLNGVLCFLLDRLEIIKVTRKAVNENRFLKIPENLMIFT